jgi:hypothetical protein
MCSFTQTTTVQERKNVPLDDPKRTRFGGPQLSSSIMTPLSNRRLLPMATMAMLGGRCSQSAQLLSRCTRCRRRIRASVRVAACHHMRTVRIGVMSLLLVMLLLAMMIHARRILRRRPSNLLMLLRRRRW